MAEIEQEKRENYTHSSSKHSDNTRREERPFGEKERPVHRYWSKLDFGCRFDSLRRENMRDFDCVWFTFGKILASFL